MTAVDNPWVVGYKKAHVGACGPSIFEALAAPPDGMAAGIAASLRQLKCDGITEEPIVYGQ